VAHNEPFAQPRAAAAWRFQWRYGIIVVHLGHAMPSINGILMGFNGKLMGFYSDSMGY